MSDERINDIESKLAYLDKQFEDLNGVVMEQDAMIRHLKAKISRMQEEHENSGSENSDKGLSPTQIAERDKPPHY